MTSSLDEAVASATAPPTPNVSGHLNMSPKENLMSPLINCKQISIGGSSFAAATRVANSRHFALHSRGPSRAANPHYFGHELDGSRAYDDLQILSNSRGRCKNGGKGRARACGADVGMLPQGAGREEMQLTSSSPKSASPLVDSNPDSARDSPIDFDPSLTPKIGVSVTRKQTPHIADSLTSESSSPVGARSREAAMVFLDEESERSQPDPMEEAIQWRGSRWSAKLELLNLNMDVL